MIVPGSQSLVAAAVRAKLTSVKTQQLQITTKKHKDVMLILVV